MRADPRHDELLGRVSHVDELAENSGVPVSVVQAQAKQMSVRCHDLVRSISRTGVLHPQVSVKHNSKSATTSSTWKESDGAFCILTSSRA